MISARRTKMMALLMMRMTAVASQRQRRNEPTISEINHFKSYKLNRSPSLPPAFDMSIPRSWKRKKEIQNNRKQF